MKYKNVLFIGNGLNRTINSEVSWDNLLDDFCKKNDIKINNNIPLPIMFESIINEYSKNNLVDINCYDEIKKQITYKIKNLTRIPSNIFKHITLKKYDSIITTNYDTNIEKYFSLNETVNINKNIKYLEIPTYLDNNFSIYHPHGHVNYEKTICLGYEHYCGIVEKSRSNLNQKIKNENSIKKIEKIVNGKIEENNWYNKFFLNDIYFIGFGMYFSEIDLWWLLTYRASIIATNRFGLKNSINNKIVFYDVVENNLSDEQSAKYEILQKMFVEIRLKKINKDCLNYEDAYIKIIEEIEKESEN